MTIEQKAKAYDDVIRKAKITLGCGNSASIATKNIIYDIFPELNPEIKKDEDKRIRKELKHYLDVRRCLTTDDEEYTTCNHFIDWLEKQNQSDKSLYIRFGDIPINGKSKIYNGEIEIGIEEGISVYPAFEDKEGNIILGLNLPITKTSLHTQQHLLEYENRPCYLVTGDYVGKGTDGEPLIKNVRIIKEIKSYRMKQDKENNTYTINNTPNCGISVYNEELNKESEDERIRKALIDYFDDAIKADENPLHGIQTHEVIDWLEKQREKRPTENVEKKFCEGDKVVSNQDGKVYIVGTEYSIRGDNICLHEIDGYHKWTNRDDLDKNYHLWTSEETDPCIGCTNDKGCVTCENGNLKEIKNEPWFKVGDWIVRGKTIMQISDIQGQYYIGIDMYGNDLTSRSDKIHLWTINDAKNGDVLAYATDEGDSWIMIYRSLYEPYEGHVHYHALLVNDDFSDKGTCCICINNLKPATKEQRELLFAKMRESGHEWDNENKELKKMEVPSEDERMKREILELVSVSGIDYNQYEEIKDWLEKQSKKKSVDEVLKIRQELYQSGYNDGYKHGQEDIAIFLGKKESIDALEHFVRSIGESGYASPYDNRTKLVYTLLERLKQIVK